MSIEKLYKKQNLNTIKARAEKFICRSQKRHHSKYDYSKVNYINAHTLVDIICPVHGIFKQKPYVHTKHGCNKCAQLVVNRKLQTTRGDFISKAEIVHNKKYTYENIVYVNSKTKINITCQIHGGFEQIPSNHLQGRGCPVCKTSHGERKIYSFLQTHNIAFIPQQKFDECINPKTGRKLPFDFYVPYYNLLIEFDGQQHFAATSLYYNTKRYETPEHGFQETKFRDNIKNNFAQSHNYNLLRIPWHKNIPKVLDEFLKIHHT